MGHPERDLWEVGVDVAARADGDVAGEVEGDAAGFSGEGFDADLRAAVGAGDVEVEEAGEAEEALDRPDGDDEADVGEGGQLGDFEVDVEAEDGEEGEELVEVEERLVEGVADDRAGLDDDDDHADG